VVHGIYIDYWIIGVVVIKMKGFCFFQTIFLIKSRQEVFMALKSYFSPNRSHNAFRPFNFQVPILVFFLSVCVYIYWRHKYWKLEKNIYIYGKKWCHRSRWSLYSLIWDFLLSQINIWTTTTWSNVWVVPPKPSWYEFLIGFLIWTPALKYLHLITFSKICVLLSMFLYL
jgi:hypothetical protein